MTIETPKATRPASHQTTMFANSPASVFYDYGTSPITSDHSLQTDLRFPSSPNSLTMYDGDADFHPSSFGSVCSNNSFVDTGQQPPNEDFDLKPQFECSDNAFLHQCLEMAADGAGGGGLGGEDSIGGVPTEAGLMKMEDIFQVDQKDAIQGPTLAELNFDSDSLSVYDDVMERESEQQKQRLVSGGCTLWQQAILQGMDSTFNVPQVVCGGQKPPIKFTTCTVTSPTSTAAVDMRMSTMETSKPSPVTTSHSTLPQSLYAVTAKLSLFSDGQSPGKVMSTDSMLGLNNTSGGFLKIPPAAPPRGGQNTLGVLGSLVPQHHQPPHQLIQPGALGGGKIMSSANPTSGGGILPIAMDTEETKSSLQRLLTDPLPSMTIKSEPVDIPMTTVPAAATPSQRPLWHSAPAAVVIAGATPRAPMSPMSPPTSAISSMGLLGAGGLPLKSSIKRTHTPEMASSAPAGGKLASMEQKWEEIKQFIYDEEEASLREEQAAELLELQQARHAGQQATSPQIRHHRQQQEQEQVALTPPKRIKVEQKDPAFTIKEEVDSGDEDNDNDSDAEDSEDGGESIVGRDQDDNSDADSDSQFSLLDENPVSSKGPPRYFWMYNTQSKGPKGKRLCKAVNTVDPYTLGDFEDPVFDPELNQTQYKHNGKARRGDGNDITPSPQKLYALGNELKKLNSTINDLTPVSELPSGARSKSRKEKNKLASRACRLKKKAQHEANKVKLYGLEREHHDLLTVLTEIREKVFKMMRERNPVIKEDEALSPKLERLMKVHLTHMIAGHTADYVNSVLAKVVSGDPKGGLAL